MSRTPRTHFPHALYHVMLRGNNGDPIFFAKEDYLRFYLFLQQGIERFQHNIHAFCLMNNHLHLLMQAGPNSISSGMQHLGFRYSRYINKKYNRIGHLFQGRFNSIVVHDESYLRELIRYIHLNPVVAGLAKQPHEYLWSSYNYYFTPEKLPWLTTEWILSRFSTDLNRSQELLKNFILKAPTEDQLSFRIFPQTTSLSRYCTSVENTLKESRRTPQSIPTFSLQDIITIVCDHFEITFSQVQQSTKSRIGTQARSLIALLIRKTPHLTLQEFAHWVQRDTSNLSKGATKLESELIVNASFRQVFVKILDTLSKSTNCKNEKEPIVLRT